MKLLQNTPLTRENPAKKLSFLRAYLNLDSSIQVLFSALTVATLFFGAVIIMSIIDSNNSYEPENVLKSKTFIAMVVGVIASILFIFFYLNRQRGLAMHEQQEYYKLGNVKPLTEQQQMALRLNIVPMYNFANWCQTLESEPCNVRLQGKKFKPKTFDIVYDKSVQQELNESWGVLNKKQYENMVAQLFEGMHSKHFAYDIQSEFGKDMVNQLSGLIKKPEEYIWNCNKLVDFRPKKLIWGFDLWRVIPMSRDAFMAGYISEEEAWSKILKASELIYYLFDSHEEFYDNYRLGNAFWSNDFNTTSKRIEMWNYFDKNCKWKIRDLEWKSQTTPNLPRVMATNFKDYIREVKIGKERGTKIGFKK